MKKFIKKTGIVVSIFSISIVIFMLGIHLIVKHSSDFKVNEENKYLIFGHSHPECAFNDDLIVGFKNLCKSGEGYFYTYHKVKEVLSDNNPNAIFIEYSNNLIFEYMDEWIWGYEKMNFFFPFHSPHMNKEDMLFLYENNPQDFIKVLSTSTRNNFTRVILFDYSIKHRYGGYKNLDRNNISKMIEERNNNPDTVQTDLKVSESNILYLEKIISYCNEKNCRVYLIRSPQHDLFPRQNEEILLKIKQEKFQNIEFLDFDRFPLHDEEFGDFGHLNYKGAEKFSNWFNELIEDGLLTKKNKKDFIEKEMENVKESRIKQNQYERKKSIYYYY